MKLTITNTGDIAVPITSGENTAVLEEGVPYELDGPTVAIIGLKPSIREQFERAYHVLTESARALLEAFQNRTKPDMPKDDTPTVAATIQNHGVNAVRVILGDGVTDETVAPGTVLMTSAKGYLELRELGSVRAQA